jgi:hypothetical protein
MAIVYTISLAQNGDGCLGDSSNGRQLVTASSADVVLLEPPDEPIPVDMSRPYRSAENNQNGYHRNGQHGLVHGRLPEALRLLEV